MTISASKTLPSQRPVHGDAAHPHLRPRADRRGAAGDRSPPRPDAAQGIPALLRARRREPAGASPISRAAAGRRSSSATPTAASTPSGRAARSCPDSRSAPTAPSSSGATAASTPAASRSSPTSRSAISTGNGRQWIVATSSTGRVYVWDSRGHRRKGWPKALASGRREAGDPAPEAALHATADPGLRRRRRCSSTSTATASWRSSRPAGTATFTPGTRGGDAEGVPGQGDAAAGDRARPRARSRSTTRSSTCRRPSPSSTATRGRSWCSGPSTRSPRAPGCRSPNGGISNVVAYQHDGKRVPGWLISDQALAFYYGSAQEFITEGVNNPVAADVDGDGRTEIASAAGIFSPPPSTTPTARPARSSARFPAR